METPTPYITAPPPPQAAQPKTVIRCPRCGQPMFYTTPSVVTGEPCLDGLENVTLEGVHGHSPVFRHKGCGGIKEYAP